MASALDNAREKPKAGGLGGLIAILIGIVAGVLLGVFYGQEMWLATGGPTERLERLRDIRKQKLQLKQEDKGIEIDAAGLSDEAAAAERMAQQYRKQAEAAADSAERETAREMATSYAAKAQRLHAAAEEARDRIYELAPKRKEHVTQLDKDIEKLEDLAELGDQRHKPQQQTFARTVAQLTEFAGDIFLQLLKLLVIPLVVTSMICGITSLGDIRKIGRIGSWTIVYYMTTGAIAVGLGILLVTMMEPGVNADTTYAYKAPNVAEKEDKTILETFLNVFRGDESREGDGMFPSNIFLAASNTNVLSLIVFALVFGGALTTIGKDHAQVAIDFFQAANEAVMKMVHLVMLFAPVGIFGLVAWNIAANGGGTEFWEQVQRIANYMLTVIIGLGIHAVILAVLLSVFARRNPITYTIGLARALLTSVSTASSSATLPITMECVEENNDVSNRSASFVLPLGSTVNMDGTALYEAVAVIFIAQSQGIDLQGGELFVVFITASLAAIGAAGIPEAGLVTMVIVLTAVGLPLEGIGMILAVDWFLDRLRTTVNVYGDAIGAGIMDRMVVQPEAET